MTDSTAENITPTSSVGMPAMMVAEDEATLTSLDATEEPTPVESAAPPSDFSDITVDLVCKMFPSGVRVQHNIEKNLPIMLHAFSEVGFTDRQLILMALATIRAETAGFEPLDEFKSKYNTSPNGHPFDLYDNRTDLGNRGAPDGDAYKGRGFVQLTGRHNYIRYSQILGMGTQLVDNPELANTTDVAAKILASFITDKTKKIKMALAKNDLRAARRLINGGSHGLKPFSDAYAIGKQALCL